MHLHDPKMSVLDMLCCKLTLEEAFIEMEHKHNDIIKKFIQLLEGRKRS